MDWGDWEKAGKISAEALEYGKSLIKEGASVKEICDKIEAKIKDLGADMAFPAQMSLNETAAHFCPDTDNDIILKDELVCLDVGAHVEGAIGDNALTVDLSGKYSELVKASREALRAALKIATPGTTISEIGRTISETIESFGYNPVKNLSGHGLDYFDIHTVPTIPNFDTKDETELIEDTVIAIEPFATNGHGLIHEKGKATVFQMVDKKPVRSDIVRKAYAIIERYEGLPFTRRWLTSIMPEAQVNFAMNQFNKLEIIKEYPPLVERSGGFVSQAEHSLIIKDKPKILTRL